MKTLPLTPLTFSKDKYQLSNLDIDQVSTHSSSVFSPNPVISNGPSLTSQQLKDETNNISSKDELDRLETSGKTSFKIKLLMITVGLPLISIVFLSILSLMKAVERRNDINIVRRDMGHSEIIRNLVHQLQIERGRSCLYVSSNREEMYRRDMFINLILARQMTDQALEKMPSSFVEGDKNVWPQKGGITNLIEFENELGVIRRKIDGRISCYELMNWFSNTDEAFISETLDEFKLTKQGTLWGKIYSYSIWMFAKEQFGMLRALGGKYFGSGYLEKDELGIYNQILGASEISLKLSTAMSDTEPIYGKFVGNRNDLKAKIMNMQNQILLGNDTEPSITVGQKWFVQVSKYLDLLHATDNEMVDVVIKSLDEIDFHETVEMVIICVIAALCLIVSPIFAMVSLNHSRHMTKLAERTRKIRIDEKKTSNLLFQILPNSIAKEVLIGKVIYPQSHASATVFVGTIVGFSDLTADCMPLELINLLNHLCTEFDAILDKRDCYKLLCTGDGFEIVSGVPKQNDPKHSYEMASVSLEVLSMISRIQIPNTGGHLIFKIGLHTGPVVSGLISARAPRYCIFGNTMDMVYQIHSTGLGMQIHLSQECRDHLRYNHGETFKMVMRGIQESQKGSIMTYWLVSKKHYKYRVDLKVAEETFEQESHLQKKNNEDDVKENMEFTGLKMKEPLNLNSI